MKENRSVLKGLVAVGVALAMVSSLAAQTVQQRVATVVAIHGDAQFGPSGNLMQPLTKVGTVLKPGMIIQTARDTGAYVDIVLGTSGEGLVTPVVFNPSASPSSSAAASAQPAAAQTVFRLWYDTALGLDKLESQEVATGVAKSDTELDLKFGHITGTIKKLTPGSSFHIKLPHDAIAGIRGTTVDISTRGQGFVHVGAGMLSLSHYVGGNLIVDDIAGGYGLNDLGASTLTPLSGPEKIDLDKKLTDMGLHRGPPFTPPGPPPYIPPVSPNRPGNRPGI